MSPARTWPWPALTTVPTMLRTIWWQKARAVISKRSTPSPRSVQPACMHPAHERDAARPSGPGLGRRQKAAKSCSPKKRVAGQVEQLGLERGRDVPGGVAQEGVGQRAG